MVITLDSESNNPGSNPGRSIKFIIKYTVKCAQKVYILILYELRESNSGPTACEAVVITN